MLHLTRATLRHSRETSAFMADSRAARGDSPAGIGHHLVWTLFEGPERDFLWRYAGRDSFWVLSQRLPSEERGILSVLPPKPLPILPDGAELIFSLRANPVVRLIDPDGCQRKHDVVSHGLSMENGSGAKDPRQALKDAIQTYGWEWLARQADRCGFAVERSAVRIDQYQRHRISRRRGACIRYKTLDFDGRLTITDSAAFRCAVQNGLGGCKGFGNGLLLLRPA